MFIFHQHRYKACGAFIIIINRFRTYPAAAAAVSTDGADEPVDHLESTQTDLNQTSDQQDAEQGQMPCDDITRTRTFIPQRSIGQVVSERKKPGDVLM